MSELVRRVLLEFALGVSHTHNGVSHTPTRITALIGAAEIQVSLTRKSTMSSLLYWDRIVSHARILYGHLDLVQMVTAKTVSSDGTKVAIRFFALKFLRQAKRYVKFGGPGGIRTRDLPVARAMPCEPDVLRPHRGHTRLNYRPNALSEVRLQSR